MAFYNDISNPTLSITERALAALANGAEVLSKRLAKRRIYRATFSELSGLSARELADLGMSRSCIRRVAIETAYGQNA